MAATEVLFLRRQKLPEGKSYIHLCGMDARRGVVSSHWCLVLLALLIEELPCQ